MRIKSKARKFVREWVSQYVSDHMKRPPVSYDLDLAIVDVWESEIAKIALRINYPTDKVRELENELKSLRTRLALTESRLERVKKAASDLLENDAKRALVGGIVATRAWGNLFDAIEECDRGEKVG